MGSVIRRYVCAVAFCAMLAGSRLDAQTLATVTGEVSDASGAAVAGATVTVRNTATNGIRNTTTNEEGVYNIPALIPGM